MRWVHLYGHLREHCGRAKVRLDVRTVGEAIDALEANFPGFGAMLRKGSYHVILGAKKAGKFVTEETVRNRIALKAGALHLVPFTGGGKSKIWAILGFVLLAAAFIFAPPAAAGAGFLGAEMGASALFGLTTFGNIALIGGAMLLNGLMTPKADFSQNEKADNRSTFFSNGATNQTEEGASVPLIYGEPIVGSVVINAGLTAEDVPVSGGESAGKDA